MDAARAAGLVGRRQVLDSTPPYDAVATMDTVTLIRSAIRGLPGAADAELEAALRAVLRREDDYRVAGKPVCDYDDPAARTALVDCAGPRRDGAAVRVGGRRPRRWWPPSSARTSTKTPRGCSASPDGSRGTG